MKNIIIGKGEVGSSLYNVLKGAHETYLRDVEQEADDPGRVEVLNICFPPSPKFDEAVRAYQTKYEPLVTIIHSSVPVGTTRRLGAVHSCIHGRHPHLEEGIRTFKKYTGGADKKATRLARNFLNAAGIHVKVCSPETSEVSKLCCTTRLGWEVVYMKWVQELCARTGADFATVWGWHKDYNRGYRKLGEKRFCRSLLVPMPGPIGGHCVINNCKLLPGEAVPEFILAVNERYVPHD